MCIICNLPTPDPEGRADRFLNEFEEARKAMQSASEAMLACSKAAVTPDSANRYDRTHKAMVRLIREWNRLEQSREHAPTAGFQEG